MARFYSLYYVDGEDICIATTFDSIAEIQNYFKKIGLDLSTSKLYRAVSNQKLINNEYILFKEEM